MKKLKKSWFLVALILVILGVIFLLNAPRNLQDAGNSPNFEKGKSSRKNKEHSSPSNLNYSSLIWLDDDAVQDFLLAEVERWEKAEVFDDEMLRLLFSIERFAPSLLPKVIERISASNERAWISFILNNTSGQFTEKCLAMSSIGDIKRRADVYQVNWTLAEKLALIQSLSDHDHKLWSAINKENDLLTRVTLVKSYLENLYAKNYIDRNSLLGLAVSEGFGIHIVGEILTADFKNDIPDLYQSLEKDMQRKQFLEGASKSLPIGEFAKLFPELKDENSAFVVSLYSSDKMNFNSPEMWSMASSLSPGYYQDKVANNVQRYLANESDLSMFLNNNRLPTYLDSLPEDQYQSVISVLKESIANQGLTLIDFMIEE